MLKIFLAGNDSRLLATRAAVLARTGASVAYGDARETLDTLDREAFDLVVLCHSLRESDVVMIVDKARKDSQCKDSDGGGQSKRDELPRQMRRRLHAGADGVAGADEGVASRRHRSTIFVI